MVNQIMLRQNLKLLVGLGLFCLTLTLILQSWVGDSVLYSKWRYNKHLVLHEAIVTNIPPEKGWHGMGANGVNVRILIPMFAETLHNVSGISLSSVYWSLDYVFLSTTLFLLFCLFLHFVQPAYALLGVLYFTIAAVCSYHFHYFHPWDRFTQMIWVGIALALLYRKDLLLFILAALLTLAKPDGLFLPLLYFALIVEKGKVKASLLKAGGLGLTIVGIVAGLNYMRPGGIDRPAMGSFLDVTSFFLKNWEQFIELFPAYPPLLILLFPLFLAYLGFRREARVVNTFAAYGILVLLPYIFLANVREVRAFLYVLIFLLPSALLAVEKSLNSLTSKTKASR